MKSFCWISFVTSILMGLPAFAGSEGGNGGDVLVCQKADGRTTYELLDLYQGREQWKLSSQEPEGQSRAEAINASMRRFQRTLPAFGAPLMKRAIQIHDEISKIESNSAYESELVRLTPNQLVDIADEGLAELPNNCEKRQAAAQTRPIADEAKFVFQKDLWNAMGPRQQASLILHEVIYEWFLNFEGNARETRYFSAALFGGKLDTVQGFLGIHRTLGYRGIFKFKELKAGQRMLEVIGHRAKFGRCELTDFMYYLGQYVVDSNRGKGISRQFETLAPAFDYLHLLASKGYCD